MPIAIYAGSFDPVTRGHEDLMWRSLTFVDKLIVAVAVNSAKQPLFSIDERVSLIRDSIGNDSRIDVREFDGLLVDFATRGRRDAFDSRAACRRGLRVRISDGSHESPPERRPRNRLHGAEHRPDLRELEYRAGRSQSTAAIPPGWCIRWSTRHCARDSKVRERQVLTPAPFARAMDGDLH